MELVLSKLPSLLTALWWPFCRVLAMFSAAPLLGDHLLPVSVRVLLSLVLAIVLLPVAAPTIAIEPFSLHAVVLTAEQALIGLAIGLAFHLTMAIVMGLGFVFSSQMCLALAVVDVAIPGGSCVVVFGLSH